MNVIREWARWLWAQHCALADRMTPMRFAYAWIGVYALATVGMVAAFDDPATRAVCVVFQLAALCMAWANATGRIR